MKIILASGSPRRIAILQDLGVEFDTHVPDVDERFLPERTPEENAVENALQKAREVSRQVEEGILIGADTIVVLGDTIYPKPTDEEEAVRMLKSLSGKKHRVITGLAFIVIRDGRVLEEVKDHEMTWVHMKPLSSEEIKGYVTENAPFDKAGAYAIQEIGDRFVEMIEGDYFNVVGFPAEKVRRILNTLLRKYAG